MQPSTDQAAPISQNVDEPRQQSPQQKQSPQLQQSKAAQQLDDDDEQRYQLARAMALAIQNNPNLTTEEIHELMKTSQIAPITGTNKASKSNQNKPSMIAPSFIKSFRNAQKGFQDIMKVGNTATTAAPGDGTAGTPGGVLKPVVEESVAPERGRGHVAPPAPQRELSELTLETTFMNIQTGITPSASDEEQLKIRTNSVADSSVAEMTSEDEEFLVETVEGSASELELDEYDEDDADDDEYNVESVECNESDEKSRRRSTIKPRTTVAVKKKLKKDSNIVMAGIKKSKRIGKAITSSMRMPSPTIKSRSAAVQSPPPPGDNNSDGAVAFDDRNKTTRTPFLRRKSNSVDEIVGTNNTIPTTPSTITVTQQQVQQQGVSSVPPSVNDMDALMPTNRNDNVGTIDAIGTSDTTSAVVGSNAVGAEKLSIDVKQQQKQETTIGGNVQQPPPQQVNMPRMSGVCWKRRGGFGKYKSDAWERRYVELIGTKLFYYLVNEGNSSNGSNPTTAATKTNDGYASTIGPSTSMDGSEMTPASSDKQPSSDKQQRRSSWLDQASALAAFTSNLNMTSNNNSNDTSGNDYMTTTPLTNNTAFTNPSSYGKARGHLDLMKEKATVQASMGHSGAPSPFALSIIVKGETKWKICFDTHIEQMEWLIAIADVVVQTSVDSYNIQLLESSDPSALINQMNTGDTNIPFRSPPPRFQPPSNNASFDEDNYEAQQQLQPQTQRRLWMMESYDLYFPKSSAFYPQKNKSVDDSNTTVSSSMNSDKKGNKEVGEITGAADDDDDDTIDDDDDSNEVINEGGVDTTDYLKLKEHHTIAREKVIGSSTKVWSIPGSYRWHVTLLWNISLFLSRSSYINISSFWYLFIGSNIIFILCWKEQPCWQSILEQHEQSSLSVTITERTVIKSKSKKRQSSKRGTKIFVDKRVDVVESTADDAATSLATERTRTHNKKYKPLAGSTTVRLINETDPPVNSKNQMFAGVRELPGETLQVRSYGYSATKQKIPSPGTLYDLAGVDIFESPNRCPDMAPRVQLPEVSFLDDPVNKTWRCPDYFVISVALPTDPPKMTSSSSDGGGYTMTIYYKMRQDTREILKRVTADGYDPNNDPENKDKTTSKVNAVRLLEEWIRRSPTDPNFQARFKIVPNAHNLKEIGMPSWISRYNGKPFLIKRTNETGFLYIHPELSCVEFDVSLHPFPYLARQGICFLKDKFFKRVVVTFGFVIEGKADDELPECLIGLVQFCYPDPQYGIQAEDFFNGTAPRSYE